MQEIVIVSIVGNWRRLGSVGMFLIMMMFWYGMSGFLFFENLPDNDGNSCRTLLECFVSYSFRGLSGEPLSEFLPEIIPPQTFWEIYQDLETLRILWEIAFTLLTVSMLGVSSIVKKVLLSLAFHSADPARIIFAS